MAKAPQTEKLENKNVSAFIPLVSPRKLHARWPITAGAAGLVAASRRAIREALHGSDRRRLILIVGPCSIHDADAAMEYARRLKGVAAATSDELLLVMRTYFEKPRTTVGWKGLINDPQLDGSCDIARGLESARKLLFRVNNLGVPCASEILDPVTPQYIADLLSWAAIGARTTESQTHREMASGLSMPVGFKNGTGGDLESAHNALISASHPHSFLGINFDGTTAIIRTSGNADRHLILRGGGGKTNFSPRDILRAARLIRPTGLRRPIMVDCAHDNAQKNPVKQIQACRAVLGKLKLYRRELLGLMLESNLNPGRQSWRLNTRPAYGVSITDPCIGWEETEELLYKAAEAVRALGA